MRQVRNLEADLAVEQVVDGVLVIIIGSLSDGNKKKVLFTSGQSATSKDGHKRSVLQTVTRSVYQGGCCPESKNEINNHRSRIRLKVPVRLRFRTTVLTRLVTKVNNERGDSPVHSLSLFFVVGWETGRRRGINMGKIGKPGMQGDKVGPEIFKSYHMVYHNTVLIVSNKHGLVHKVNDLFLEQVDMIDNMVQAPIRLEKGLIGTVQRVVVFPTSLMNSAV